MAVYNIGNLIKLRREELGLTQEELSDGICSVPTLSRIENGVNPPTRSHAQALLQRLGYSDVESFITTGETEFEIARLQYKCRFANIDKDRIGAIGFLDQLSAFQDAFSPTDRQFYDIMYLFMMVNLRIKRLWSGMRTPCVLLIRAIPEIICRAS